MPRITAYKQLEHSDCGITCIRIIAKYYGKEIPLKILRGLCDISRIGISINDIVNSTYAIGLKSIPIKVDKYKIYQLPLPAILYWDQRHYVVLYKIDKKKDKFYIVDPAQGKIVLLKEDFFRYWINGNCGIAILVAPTPQFYKTEYCKDNNSNGLIELLVKSIVKYKSKFLIIVIFTIIAVIADMALPIIFRRIIDDGVGNRNIGLVWLLSIGQLCIFIGSYIASNVTEYVLTKLGLYISINLVSEYLLKLIKLPISFFDRKIKSDLIQKLDDQNRVKNFLVNMPDTTFFTFINLVVFSTMLIYYNYIIFLIIICSTIFSFLWVKLFSQKRREIDYSLFSYLSLNRNNVYELINGMPEIKINNAQQNRVSIWNSIQEKINRLSLKSALIEMSISSGNTFISRVKDISITGICATFVINNNMTIGSMMTISYIVGRLTSPISNLISSIKVIQDASISYERLDEVLNQDDIENNEISKTGNDVLDINEQVVFKDVSFKYPGSFSPYVIKNISTIIPRNKITAIVGPSGSGKSTLIKLMLGFYTPQNGELHVGTNKLADIDNDLWLKQCGVVMQSGYIFSGSVIENIALSDSSPDFIKVKNAAKIACIDSFFENLPMGYNTRIGTNGIELSGGQQQRLYIARAIYKNPSYLFLDEATSSLDANNEFKIINNLISFYKNRTVIISAHRLSTVKNADKIIYLDGGEIKEQGSHEELISLKGYYYTLIKNQLELDG